MVFIITGLCRTKYFLPISCIIQSWSKIFPSMFVSKIEKGFNFGQLNFKTHICIMDNPQITNIVPSCTKNWMSIVFGSAIGITVGVNIHDFHPWKKCLRYFHKKCVHPLVIVKSVFSLIVSLHFTIQTILSGEQTSLIFFPTSEYNVSLLYMENDSLSNSKFTYCACWYALFLHPFLLYCVRSTHFL